MCFNGRSGAAPPPDSLYEAALSTPRKAAGSAKSRKLPPHVQSVAYHVRDAMHCPTVPVISARTREGENGAKHEDCWALAK